MKRLLKIKRQRFPKLPPAMPNFLMLPCVTRVILNPFPFEIRGQKTCVCGTPPVFWSRLTHDQLLFTWNASPKRSWKLSFEHLPLPPRSAPRAVLLAKSFIANPMPSDFLLHRVRCFTSRLTPSPGKLQHGQKKRRKKRKKGERAKGKGQGTGDKGQGERGKGQRQKERQNERKNGTPEVQLWKTISSAFNSFCSSNHVSCSLSVWHNSSQSGWTAVDRSTKATPSTYNTWSI